jgi:hypothetical protein
LGRLTPQAIEFELLLFHQTTQALHLPFHGLDLEGQVGGALTVEDVLDPVHATFEILGGRQGRSQDQETSDGERGEMLLHD